MEKPLYLALKLGQSATQFSVGKTSYKIYPYETFVVKPKNRDRYRIGIQNTFTGSWQTFNAGRKYFDANKRQYEKLVNESKLHEISYSKPTIST